MTSARRQQQNLSALLVELLELATPTLFVRKQVCAP